MDYNGASPIVVEIHAGLWSGFSAILPWPMSIMATTVTLAVSHTLSLRLHWNVNRRRLIHAYPLDQIDAWSASRLVASMIGYADRRRPTDNCPRISAAHEPGQVNGQLYIAILSPARLHWPCSIWWSMSPVSPASVTIDRRWSWTRIQTDRSPMSMSLLVLAL